MDIGGLKMESFLLVGLGPHSKRIYRSFFEKYGKYPKMIIDLESKRDAIYSFLKSKGKLEKIETFFLKDKNKDTRSFDSDIESLLSLLINNNGISHAIISTEPKAHFAYLDFFGRHGISVLSDKPLTAIKDASTDSLAARKIQTDFDYLVDLRKGTEWCKLMYQRRCHKGYLYIKKLIDSIIIKHNIPITHISICHCDGMRNMPNEFVERENHPYKYGYGKLFHSGCHFLDLLARFIDSNDNIKEKRIDNVELYSSIVRPNDFMKIINANDYLSLLGTDKFIGFSDKNFDTYGEIDFHGIYQFNKKKNVITVGEVILLQNGFSRRSWECLPKDTYKGNGRIRHESINIQIGPLINIQLHSYQSKEIRDPTALTENSFGMVNHFEIHIYRNVGVIGGKAFEIVKLESLYSKKELKASLGHNEYAREQCLFDFFKNGKSITSLSNQRRTVLLLEASYQSMVNRYHDLSPVLKKNW